MANSDKNILITPSVGLSTNPTIKFTGANNTPTTLRVLDDGTVSFEGTAGQLFSISDGLTGSIFSVNDISGIPSIEVLDTGLVKLNQYGGSTVFGASAAIQNASSVNAKVSISTASATTPGLIIKAVSSQTANLQEWQNSSASILAQVDAYGSASFGGNNTYGSSLGVGVGGNASQKGITVRGTASQTADLQQWQDSSATVLAKVDASGFVNGSAYRQIGGNSNGFGIGTISGVLTAFGSGGNTTVIPIVTRGAASQSADLQQWQDGYSNVLASIGSSGQVLINPSNASVTALTVKSSPTYPAAMQQWQNSSGTTLAQIRYNGILDIYTISPLNSNSGSYMDFTSSSININSRSTTTPTFIVSSTASQTANIQEWKNSSGTALAYINSSGDAKLGAVALGNGVIYDSASWLNIATTSASQIGAIIKGYTSQTANLQEWQNSAGTVLTKVRSSGQLNVGGAVTGTTLGIINIDPAWTAVKVVGASSQTASLQEWQLNDGTVRAKVDVDGYMGSTGVFGTTGKWSLETAYGGAFMGLAKTTSTVVNPGSDMARMYLVAGTNAGTLKLVVKAGASGAETTILDNIPQS